MTRLAETQRIRIALLHAGYLPLPAHEKAVLLKGWRTIQPDDTMIAGWSREHVDWTNSGVRAADTPGVDIDVLDVEAAAEIEAVVRRHIGDGVVLVRTGLAPKRLIPFRASYHSAS